jgi:hypothetical protein
VNKSSIIRHNRVYRKGLHMSTDLSQNGPSDDWITQADAARIRGVSRQAVSKLVNKGRLSTMCVGGIVFVSRIEIETFKPKSPGRPKTNG